jgi:excisionase family DNA binding protein
VTKVEAQEPTRPALADLQVRGAASEPGDVTGARGGSARRRQLPVHLSPIRVDPDRPARPLTRAEAARRLGRHARTLDRWTRLGLLRTIEIAGTVRIPADEVERLRRPNVPRSEP